MKKERKLRRLDFDLIQAEMSVIDGELLRSIVGGYSNDCFWRCIAYIESGGSSYSESDANSYAEAYFGSGVDLNKRKDGVGLDTNQMREYINNNYNNSSDTSYTDSKTQYLVVQFDPQKVPGLIVGSTTHVAIYQKDFWDKNGIPTIQVYDPQQKAIYNVPKDAWIESFTVGNSSDGSNSSSNYGSSNYGSSSSYYG